MRMKKKKNENINLKLNADRFTGSEYVNLYDTYRPSPPIEIIHQTLNYLNKTKADIIVDLGSGTGISTDIWSNYSKEVIGIEPSKEMIAIAEKKATKKHNSKYLVGYSNKIPLASKSVDIISCSQSFHWMEPITTLAEINRVLKNNGVLVIYDVIWPPSINFEFENAYNELFLKVDELTKTLKDIIAHRWNKQEHLINIAKSNYFNFLKESYFHKNEKVNKEQFVGIALSQGGLEALLKRGFSEEEIGIIQFKNKIANNKSLPYNKITYNYRVIYGIK